MSQIGQLYLILGFFFLRKTPDISKLIHFIRLIDFTCCSKDSANSFCTGHTVNILGSVGCMSLL